MDENEKIIRELLSNISEEQIKWLITLFDNRETLEKLVKILRRLND